MNNTEVETSQPLGLDVGTSRIVVARNADSNYSYEAQLNAFITLPYSKLAENLLVRENVFHEVRGAEIVVAGNDAEKFAEVFHVETRRPMANGVLNAHEPHSLAVVRMIIGKLCGTAGERQRIFFSIPARPPDGDGGVAYHEASIRQMLTELGYTPHAIEEGLAVVFGELGAVNYTGIGISCGSGMCNVCLAVLSMPVLSFSVPRAGDFIDYNAASVTGEVINRIRVLKEHAFRINGLSGNRFQNAISVYYDEMIQSLTGELRAHFADTKRIPKLDQPVPLVLSGGSVMPKGFLDRFIHNLRANEFPVRLADVRLSSDPLNSTARGALMAALC